MSAISYNVMSITEVITYDTKMVCYIGKKSNSLSLIFISV